MVISKTVMNELSQLRPLEKAKLIDHLLISLENPEKDIEAAWTSEAQSRLASYEKGEMKAVSLKEVLRKYQ